MGKPSHGFPARIVQAQYSARSKTEGWGSGVFSIGLIIVFGRVMEGLNERAPPETGGRGLVEYNMNRVLRLPNQAQTPGSA